MTRVQMGLSGAGARTSNRATGAQDWRQPAAIPRSSVDWTAPENATPKPEKKWGVKRHSSIELDDTPQLPERTIRVRAHAPATYYTAEGMPIGTEWVAQPVSPGLLKAIAVGDLEEDKSGGPAPHRRAARAQPTPGE